MITSTTQLRGEREFAGFGDPELPMCGFGAATGACREKKSGPPSKPSVTIKRIQTALRGLVLRAKDPLALVDADGLVGPHTVKTVNYVMPKYTDALAPLNSGKLTKAQVVSMAPQIAAFIERAPVRIAGKSTITFQPAANLPGAAQPAYAATSSTAPSGGSTPMPYPAQPQYYPPGYAPAPSYPGYAPPREASVDTKIFIPAQYEHVSFNPMTVALILAVGVGTVMVMNKKAQYKKIG